MTSIGWRRYFLAPAAGAAVCVALAARASASARLTSRSFCILPPCFTNFFVGENSPSLWPTMFSTTRTGRWSLPLYTPMVKPTISGVIDAQRDQVLMTVLSFGLRFLIFLTSFSSIAGPFLRLRDIGVYLRRFTMSFHEVFFRSLVFTPSAGLPHFVFGCLRPIGCLPSPPPCG